MNEGNLKEKVKSKKVIIVTMLVLVSFISILLVAGVPRKSSKKELIKNFEIQTLANMYVMVEITKQYIAGEIDPLEFSRRENILSREMDKVEFPDDIAIEGMVLSYTSSCSYVVVSLLNAVKDGENPIDAIDKPINLMISSMNILKDKIATLHQENEIDITFEKDVQKVIDELLIKVR